MSEMIDNPFVALTFIAGPAILTNACAILQNSADPDAAIGFAQRRIRLLLRGLDCLYAAVALFGVGALLGLIGAILAAEGRHVLPIWLVVGVGGAGLTLLLAAMGMFTAESRCARSLLKLQLRLDPPSAPVRVAR